MWKVQERCKTRAIAYVLLQVNVEERCSIHEEEAGYQRCQIWRLRGPGQQIATQVIQKSIYCNMPPYYVIKYSRATSSVKWLKGEKTNVSRAISVLVHRVLIT
jgi:hypothetical protein